MEKIKNKIFNEDCLIGIKRIPNDSLDLVIADPPYCLGKDYENNSDKLNSKEYLEWTYKWINLVIPKLKDTGSLYIFLSWQYSPEIFSYIKTKMPMINEIIWDRRVPSIGRSTKKISFCINRGYGSRACSHKRIQNNAIYGTTSFNNSFNNF